MKKILYISLIIILTLLAIFLYAMFIGTKGLIIKEYKVTNENIGDNSGIKVVHFSDVHYNTTIKLDELKIIVDEINKIDPDIVLFTGDLVDKNHNYNNNELIEVLSSISATLGKFYILGNHDTNIDDINFVFSNSGFVNVNNSYKSIYYNEEIIISGFSSTENNEIITENSIEYINANKDAFSILLLHEPDIVDNLDISNYDLIVAGHSHGGQVRLPIIGGIINNSGSLVYNDEYYNVNGTDLYISSGLGCSFLNIRLFNKPSFNFYRISNK